MSVLVYRFRDDYDYYLKKAISISLAAALYQKLLVWAEIFGRGREA
jgi:hypothetical protein